MKLTIGEIVKAQGIKGEVKVRPLTDDPAQFDATVRCSSAAVR